MAHSTRAACAVILVFLAVFCHSLPLQNNNNKQNHASSSSDPSIELQVCLSLNNKTNDEELTFNCDQIPAEMIVAKAKWIDSCNSSGWGDFRVYGNENFPMQIQSAAMGMLEGYLTQHRIFEAKTNMFAHAFGIGKPAPPAVAKFYQDQLNFVRTHSVTPPPPSVNSSSARNFSHLKKNGEGGDFAGKDDENSPVWGPLSIIMSQFDGLVYGYNLAVQARGASTEEMTELDMYIHNGAGDLEDLGEVLPGIHPLLSLAKRYSPDINMLDCSALIRVSDKNEIFAAHTTWRDYSNMAPRIYKYHYFNTNTTREWSVSFSSTPGFLSSKDDFYIVKSPWSEFVVLETTNAVFNQDLYKLLTPSSLMTWQRTMVANMIAENGNMWTSVFGKFNNGCYNNQWMVLDLKQFRSNNDNKTSIPANTLWILEQIPGQVQSRDVSDVLAAQKYWGSYNVPYFEEIYNASGYNTKNGSLYSYNDCPRANIFRERAPKVQTIEDMKFLMQYNDYKNDPLSLGSPLNAISSRYDLVEGQDPRAFGGIDSKVTSDSLTPILAAQVISGPTQQQPAFSWSNFHSKAAQEHEGQVDAFDFKWVNVAEDKSLTI